MDQVKTIDVPESRYADGMTATATLEALYRSQYAPMVRLAFALVSNNAEAEELVQEAFLDVFRLLDGIRNPEAYLRRAVVSRSRSVLRRRLVRSSVRSERPVDLTPSADELWDVLDRLSDDQRLVVVLRYYAGYRAVEISEMIDQPASTVRSHLRRALVRLRKELSR